MQTEQPCLRHGGHVACVMPPPAHAFLAKLGCCPPVAVLMRVLGSRVALAGETGIVPAHIAFCTCGCRGHGSPSSFAYEKEPSLLRLVQAWTLRRHLCPCRHMVLLKERYGKQVVVNLLGSRGGEEVLNRAFKVSSVRLHTGARDTGGSPGPRMAARVRRAAAPGT